MSENNWDDVQPFVGLPAVQEESPGALVDVAAQREVAEVQAAMAIAKRFPRNQAKSLDRVLVACQRPSLAERALYSYSRGGSDISGPSIRLAEAIAQQWGNLQFGIRELDQKLGESTVEAFAWDLETNTRQVKVFQVKHRRRTKKGTYDLEDPRDIYEMVANQGARRMRACILGVIPGDVVDAAVEQCESTLKAKADVSPEAIKKMVDVFGQYGVNKTQIETRIQRKLEAITAAQVISLRKIYNSLKDGMSRPEDWFESAPEQPKEEKKERKPRKTTSPEPPQETISPEVGVQIPPEMVESIEEIGIYCSKLGMKEETVALLFTEDKNRRTFDKMTKEEMGKCLGYLLDKWAEKEEQSPE